MAEEINALAPEKEQDTNELRRIRVEKLGYNGISALK